MTTDKKTIIRKTNWYVITGAPCSGKSSVIRELQGRGYQVVHEVARAYIDAEMAKGKRLAQIKSDVFAFESRILYQKMAIEASLSTQATIFFDRGVPDSIAYFKFTGLDSKEPEEESRRVRYNKIFLFDRLRFETDAVRAETDHLAATIEQLIEKSYGMLGYDIVRVPLLTVEERADYILKYV
jgi:predicted ATPase